MAKKYFAFISYLREDEDWAKWFQNELESYHLPSALHGRVDINFDELPKEFRPVFRDIDELKAGNLPEQIYNALESSLNLVVICSPMLADDIDAKWVNKEISDFIEIGKKEGIDNVKHIFPFIIDGIPHAGDKRECFPKTLRNLSEEQERIGGNVNEGGDVTDDSRDRAFVKVLAGMLPDSVTFDMLWDRYERDKIKKEREEKEIKDKLMIGLSRFLSEKATALVDQGDAYLAKRLLLEVLPKNVDNQVDVPYTVEANSALRYAMNHNSTILRGFSSYVTSAVYSPDGGLIATLSNNSLRLWDANTGILIWDSFITGPNSVSFSPDGKRIATSSIDRTVRIWNTETGMQIGKPLVGHTYVVNTASFSPDGRLIVSGSADRTVRIWDLESGCQIGKPFEGHRDGVETVAFSPDGKRIVSQSLFEIRIWDIESKRQIGKPFGNEYDDFRSVAYSHDGKRLVTISDEKTISIWDVQSGKRIGKPLVGHTQRVNCASFSPDDNLIVSASDDNTIRFWDAKSGIQIGEPFTGHTGSVYSAAFSPDGKNIVSASRDQTVRIWDSVPENQNQESSVKYVFSGDCLSLSHDCKHLVIGEDKVGLIMNVKTRRQIGDTLEGHTERLICAAFSPDDNYIVTGSADNTLHIWDALTGQQVGVPLVGHTGWINSVAFSPDGLLIASGSNDRSVRIWDAATGFQIREPLDSGCDPVNALAFSPNGNLLASASGKRVFIWDVKKECLIGEPLYNLHDGDVGSVAFSPDGKRIVTASYDKTIRIWDLETGRQIGYYSVGYGVMAAASASFSPDGKCIVSLSQDKTVRIWDATMCRQIGEPLGKHSGMGVSVYFKPDGRHVVSVGNQYINIWEFPSLQELINQVYDRFKDYPLTSEERRRFYLE